ncbi:LysR family transcriptional regulator [Pseudomonas sp. RIT-PI-S]|uniref:LysR family transcriptional regulator n=1 Tax=Pseudomonas sp. RIT-PI-S TaxID=3035295 RepID=UPI0021D8F6B6|nr:LysR family transcriptional regulator [Pseudomonas sp. RIT-PI-S]
MHIDLRQLRHLLALHEHRSFVAAAVAVNLSQSAFSRSIQALEHLVGHQLVDRAQKNLPPTKQGLVVLEHARRLVSGASQLSNEIAQLNGIETAELRFGCGPAPAAGLVPRAIGRFIERYPRARVNLQVEDWQSLAQRLLAQEFEFFVADTRQFEADPDYETLRLQPRKWHFCCRQGHPLAALKSVPPAALFSYPLAVTIRPPNLRKVIVELSGKPDYLPTVQCEHTASLLAVVLHSDAIGICGVYNDALASAGGRLVRLEVQGLDPACEETFTRYGIVHRSGRSLSPLSRAMIEYIRQADEDLQDQREALTRLAV